MKKEKTALQIYERNKKTSKWLGRLAPCVFWILIGLSIFLFIMAIKNSLGNMAELLDLLDSKKYTGEELSQNYAMLIEKYGEWTIGSGGSGFQVDFINLGKAVFGGIMVMECILSVVCLVSAFVIGRWLMPKMSQMLRDNNQDDVNEAILKQQETKNE